MHYELLMFRLINMIFLRWALTTLLLSTHIISLGLQANEIYLSKLSVCPRDLLSPFFHNLLTETSAGYVMFSHKPIFLHDVRSEIIFFPGTSEHRRAVVFGEAVECLVPMLPVFGKEAASNYRLVLWTNPHRNKDSVKSMTIINKVALTEVIKKNQSLFQSRLGWRATSETILTQILNSKEGIGQLYSGHPDLIGICLGYGTQNSILYERTSRLIQLATSPTPKTPFRIVPAPSNEQELTQQLEDLDEPSSLTYSSLRAELADITLGVRPPSFDLDGNGTKIPFSYWSRSIESSNLLQSYQEAQKKVQQCLDSSDYLNILLLKLDIDPNLLDDPAVFRCCAAFEGVNFDWIAKCIACSIWEQYEYLFPEGKSLEMKQTFLSAVEKGLTEDLRDVIKRDSVLQALAVYRRQHMENSEQRELNIFAKQYLNAMQNQKGLLCVDPKRLYYSVKKEGVGAVLDKSSKEIEAHFLVKDIDGTVINGSNHLMPVPCFTFSDLSIGVAHGMLGMLEGEEREIYIHPDYMYGLDSSVGSGKPLIVTIQLVRIKSRDALNPLPTLLPVDLPRSVRDNVSSLEQLKQCHKDLLELFGHSVGTHYRLGSEWIPSQRILSALKNTLPAVEEELILSPEQRAVIRRIHWVLYNVNSSRL